MSNFEGVLKSHSLRLTESLFSYNKSTMHELILTIGIPGCGKSTWASNYCQDHPGTIVISSDGIRKELTGSEECIPSMNPWIFSVVQDRVKTGILEHDVIVDATNVSVNDWTTYKALCPPDTVCKARFFDIDPVTAMERQSHRERQVPREVLDNMWKILCFSRAFLTQFFDVLLEHFERS